MKTFRFTDSVVVMPDGVEPLRSISVESGCVAAINLGDGDGNDFENCTVLPGFIDVHNHGAVGVDVNSATADELMKVARFLATKGVTAWMPTLVPDSDDKYERAIEAIDELMRLQVGAPVAQAVGVHYEGVFANHAMCGALRSQYFKSGQWAVGGGRLPELEKGVRMMTLAPEIEGGIDLVKQLVADGWIVSIGHTAADRATLNAAFEAGARHLTHFFNAMKGVHHRDMGVAGWGLASDDVTFDIIADGVHVEPEMLRLALKAKSPDKVSLISDSVAPAGLGDGEYELWGEKITVENGRTRNSRGRIAGSVSTMLDGVVTARGLGFGDAEIASMASTNPARLLKLDDRGVIEVGRRADLVGIDSGGNIVFAMIGGEIVAEA